MDNVFNCFMALITILYNNRIYDMIINIFEIVPFKRYIPRAPRIRPSTKVIISVVIVL